MHRHERLRRRQDFTAAYREGRATSGDLLVLRSRPNQLGHNRYGFSVSKRVGTAVVRNRVKRRLRAAVTALLVPAVAADDGMAATQGWDLIVIARAPAATVDYDELVRALARLLRRARILPDAAGARQR